MNVHICHDGNGQGFAELPNGEIIQWTPILPGTVKEWQPQGALWSGEQPIMDFFGARGLTIRYSRISDYISGLGPPTPHTSALHSLGTVEMNEGDINALRTFVVLEQGRVNDRYREGEIAFHRLIGKPVPPWLT